MTHFHFSIGPVQEFVNQARRTSDFWAGSFLLSWLAGVAMCAVQRQGGTINFPLPPDDYLDWIEGKAIPANGAALARIGAIPNRFSATVLPGFQGQAITDCVREAWVALARHTLQQDGLHLTPEGQTIWARQIETAHGGLWDMHWVQLNDDELNDELANGFATSAHAPTSHHRLLDLRKHWRSHYPDKEPGRKCSLMHGWQELSGARYNAVEQYWQDERAAYLQRNQREGKMLDINEREHLCALAYVKRRFVQHFARFRLGVGSSSSSLGQTLHGWALPPNVPSTQYLAAAPWLAKVLGAKKVNLDHIRRFESAARASGVNAGEARTGLLCVEQAAQAWKEKTGAVPILHGFDGVAFFEDEIRSQTRPDTDRPFDALRNTEPLIAALKCLQQQHGSAAKYYALLLMDGDSIGSILDTEPIALAQALKAFTNGVAPIVQKYSGFLVYAGGDDVLALLPMDMALPCALALRQFYQTCFKPYPAICYPSISAAIEFAHFKTPLTQITNDAHQLLDDIAKKKHGRDSLAVRVWKGSGIHLTWCQPWPIALKPIEGSESRENSALTLVLQTLLGQFQTNPKLFSSGFFFRANDVYAATRGIGDAQAVKELILYEYGHSLVAKHNGTTRAEIEALLEPLYIQSIPHWRSAADGGQPPAIVRAADPQADCALLIRFLWQKGFEANNDDDNNDDDADKHNDQQQDPPGDGQ